MKKALLVGINKYPGSPLYGCVNDITDMANLLVAKGGYKPSNIRLLTDGRATTKAIWDRLNWLLNGLSSGDEILFHYSGHGSQSATRNSSDEIDGLDEVICPVDYNGEDNHLIRDKQLHATFDKIPQGVHFVWVSDSCHSGDLSRGMHLNRSIPNPEDLEWRIKAAMSEGMQAAKDTSKLNGVLISGCKANQTSADATFTQRANGALTYFLLSELNKGKNTSKPLDSLIKMVVKRVKEAGFSQTPSVEGSQTTTSFIL